jgi:ribosomal protein L30
MGAIAAGKGSARRRDGRQPSSRRTRSGARRLRPLFGDLLVQQVKSAIGATHLQRSSLRSLGLVRIGRASVVRSETASVRGQLHDVRHLIAVKPLTVAARDRLHLHEAVPAMRTVPYEVEGKPARRYDVSSSFLAVELYDEAFSLTWSTELPFSSIFRRIASMLPSTRSDTTAVVFDRASRRQLELHAEPLLEGLRVVDEAYQFVSIDFMGLTVAWRCPEYPRHVDHDVLPGELGVVSESFDAAYFAQLVRATAPPALGERAEQIIADAAWVGDHVRVGAPGGRG